ncbi:MAG: hypothetical protein R3E12_06470 [Candidatus Eisenbacteria bacterium]
MLEWVSSTSGDYDGVRVLVYDDPTVDSGNAITFQTGLYARTFTMAELEDLDLLVDANGGRIGSSRRRSISRLRCAAS